MTIKIENTQGSNKVLCTGVGQSGESMLVPVLWPGDNKLQVDPGKKMVIFYIPLDEDSAQSKLIVLEKQGSDDASTIPIGAIMGKDVESFLVESYKEGKGGKVNERVITVEEGSIPDEGIIYIAS